MQQEKAKREREILRQLLEYRLDVIESKSNEVKMIASKKAAWQAVRQDMISAGFNRSTQKIEQQWTRMKVAAKRSNAAMKKALKATGNVVPLPVCDPSDGLVQAMISEQLQEDTIYIDSNTDTLPDYYADDDIAAHAGTSDVSQFSPYHQSDTESQKGDTDFKSPPPLRPSAAPVAEDLLLSLRQLSKKARTKVDVMTSRVNQIDEGTSHAAELHLLQIEHAKQVLVLDTQLLMNAKEENVRAREKHTLEVELMKEYHNKRMQDI